MARLRRLLETVEGATLAEQLRHFLDRVALSRSGRDDREVDRAERVNLLTLHSTKGLEFSRAYVIGVEDGQFARVDRDGRGPSEEELHEARRLLSVRERFGVVLGEAFMVRTHPQWLEVRELVRSGRIGELKVVAGHFSYHRNVPGDIRDRVEWGGGVLMDVGCYPVTLSRWLFGAEPVDVVGLLERDPIARVDRLASGLLRFPTGRATFTCAGRLVPFQRSVRPAAHVLLWLLLAYVLIALVAGVVTLITHDHKPETAAVLLLGLPNLAWMAFGLGLGGAQVHNAWWFHNPTNNEKRYLFLGQEGPASIGSRSSGDIHVLDVSDLAHPVEVASFGMADAGTHNFWMDEANEILYAAYYNAGVVALDVSGTLSGDLSSRELARVQPGGAGNTYTWSVQLADTVLYAIDMLSGLWRLTLGSSFGAVTGGNNVAERFSSDMWIHGNYGYTATWGGFRRDGNPGNALKVWRLDAGPAPTLVDSVIVPGVATLSDVQASDDGTRLVVSAEGLAGGLYVYDLADPARPVQLGFHSVPSGLHTVTLSTIGGRLYAFGARNPPGKCNSCHGRAMPGTRGQLQARRRRIPHLP